MITPIDFIKHIRTLPNDFEKIKEILFLTNKAVRIRKVDKLIYMYSNYFYYVFDDDRKDLIEVKIK